MWYVLYLCFILASMCTIMPTVLSFAQQSGPAPGAARDKSWCYPPIALITNRLCTLHRFAPANPTPLFSSVDFFV